MDQKSLIGALLKIACRPSGIARWRAISLAGAVVANLARDDLEAAREVVRRLLWTLNEESGGIGWGSPEIFGEIICQSRPLCDEYAAIFFSYVDSNENFLEFEPLQRGLLWGLGRLLRCRDPIWPVEKVAARLAEYMRSSDAGVRGMAAWAAGALDIEALSAGLEALFQDTEKIDLYDNGRLESVKISDLARGASRVGTK